MKVKARYENGILIPEKRLFPKQSTLTIEVADEDLEPEAIVSEPAPAPKAEWTEEELKTFESFPGLRKAWEILRKPVSPEEMTDELSPKQAERWEAINYATKGR
jgi:hypothetical protein